MHTGDFHYAGYARERASYLMAIGETSSLLVLLFFLRRKRRREEIYRQGRACVCVCARAQAGDIYVACRLLSLPLSLLSLLCVVCADFFLFFAARIGGFLRVRVAFYGRRDQTCEFLHGTTKKKCVMGCTRLCQREFEKCSIMWKVRKNSIIAYLFMLLLEILATPH